MWYIKSTKNDTNKPNLQPIKFRMLTTLQFRFTFLICHQKMQWLNYKVVQIWPGLICTNVPTNQSQSYLNHLVF